MSLSICNSSLAETLLVPPTHPFPEIPFHDSMPSSFSQIAAIQFTIHDGSFVKFSNQNLNKRKLYSPNQRQFSITITLVAHQNFQVWIHLGVLLRDWHQSVCVLCPLIFIACSMLQCCMLHAADFNQCCFACSILQSHWPVWAMA